MVELDTLHTSAQYNKDLPLLTPQASPDLYAKLRAQINNVDKDVEFDKLLPFDLAKYKKLAINPFETTTLTAEQVSDLEFNVQLCRDIIVFFTSCGAASGYGGHTGGAYDTVPEVVILDAFFRACPDQFVPIFFDEAGHRVATQYLMAALDGYLAPEFLRFYRFGYAQLPGHPELGLTPGIQFSSGRLGHMWGTVNGIALANPGKRVIMLGSDGSQMEGNNAEAARLAVAKSLNVKLVIDDNNITITGHPSDYLPGYDIEKTLQGHGMTQVSVLQPEGQVVALFDTLRTSVVSDGPAAVICRRKMAPGIDGVEDTSHGHDTLATKYSIPYLQAKGHTHAAEYLQLNTKTKDPHSYQGTTGEWNAMRKVVGQTILNLISAMPEAERKDKVLVVDSDLGGSTNMAGVEKATPEVFCHSGVMERGNFAAAAGFGMHPEKQGVFSTFAAFLEMLCSEITMARLNNSNVFSHFSHSGVDDMSDNTCHFGLNHFFADNGLNDGYETSLYFPADPLQAQKVVERTFPLQGDGFTNKGLRFVFTTRSKTPIILKEGSTTEAMYGDDYQFVPGKDEIVRTGTAGYIVSFGDALYRSLDAVENLKAQGIDVGLINKVSLNIIDSDMMETLAASPMVLVSECLGYKTGLGSKMGSWLLETKHAQQGGSMPKFGRIATHHEGCGGLWEQAYHQGFDSASVQTKVKEMLGKN